MTAPKRTCWLPPELLPVGFGTQQAVDTAANGSGGLINLRRQGTYDHHHAGKQAVATLLFQGTICKTYPWLSSCQ